MYDKYMHRRNYIRMQNDWNVTVTFTTGKGASSRQLKKKKRTTLLSTLFRQVNLVQSYLNVSIFVTNIFLNSILV